MRSDPRNHAVVTAMSAPHPAVDGAELTVYAVFSLSTGTHTLGPATTPKEVSIWPTLAADIADGLFAAAERSALQRLGAVVVLVFKQDGSTINVTPVTLTTPIKRLRDAGETAARDCAALVLSGDA